MNFRIFHPRRSGGHAVIFWLLNSSGSYAFYNSLPLVSSTPKLPREKTPGVAGNLFWSHEDPNRDKPLASCISSFGVSWMPRPDHDVFILRDFYNYAASKMRAGEKRGEKFSASWRECDSKAWLDFAKQYAKRPKQFIVYNQWLCDKDYRSEVASRYGFKAAPYDAGVSEYGGGSSFSGTKEPANSEALLKRYVGMEESILPLCSPEMAAINKSIFGWSL